MAVGEIIRAKDERRKAVAEPYIVYILVNIINNEYTKQCNGYTNLITLPELETSVMTPVCHKKCNDQIVNILKGGKWLLTDAEKRRWAKSKAKVRDGINKKNFLECEEVVLTSVKGGRKEQ